MKPWLRYLWENEDGFFGVGLGPSSQETGLESALAGAGSFATGEGEGDILASDNFWKAILSGDPGQISKVLGPQMSAINKQGQEAKKTGSEFGNRGGGTNAGMQMTDDKTRTSIDDMISKLTGSAASSLGSQGSGLLSTGVSANNAAFGAANTIHDQKEAKWNDIFKSSISVAAAPFTGGASLSGLSDTSGGFSNPFKKKGSGTGQGPMADPLDDTDLGI